MQKPVTVITSLIKNKDKFLIVKRKSTSKIHPNLWMFPGGKTKPKEDIIQTLKREIKEETNLEITILKKISEYEYKRPDNTLTLGQCFLSFSKTKEVKINKELEDFKWITKEEFKNYPHLKELESELTFLNI